MPAFIFFTDLDGTLLDHRTYSPEKAESAVGRLMDAGIPLVFCSSKTPAEQIHLQQSLKIEQPFIFENGGGIAYPAHSWLSDYLDATEQIGNFSIHFLSNRSYEEIAQIVRHIQSHCDIALPSFHHLSDSDMERLTDLKPPEAFRAKERKTSYTIARSLVAEEGHKVNTEIAKFGLRLSKGGRFYTIVDESVSKGEAVKALTRCFHDRFPTKMPTIGVGDAQNDAPMLEAVDFPFLLKGHDGKWANLPRLLRLVNVPLSAGAGFSEVVDWALQRLATAGIGIEKAI